MSKLALALFTASTLVCACGDDDSVTLAPDAAPEEVTILATAQATPELSTLVAAVQFASENNDLVNLLASPGTLTVFAPTNAAFDALAVEITGDPNATGPDLLTPANKALLRSVLQYHVLTTEVMAAEIPFGSPITTAEGSFFKIDTGTPPVITDGRNRTAEIIDVDIEATNGVVHVIDAVLLPPNQNVVQTAQSLAAADPGEFNVLVEAVGRANLAPTLSGSGPYTVFAPTDAAFAALLAELGVTKEELLADRELLASVLSYHVVPSLVLAADIPFDTRIATVETGTIVISDDLVVTDERGRTVKIVRTDVLTDNGVIHVIDGVLLPAP
ncbi:MAG: fasciclin domain-containing protein [Kofleriaceae bacterium]|nr:fasciclin domain-containing protein [Kofleriaceae bacterium]